MDYKTVARKIGQAVLNAEKNTSLYGQFNRGIREAVGPIVANVSPQEAQRYQSFSQPEQKGVGSLMARMAGEATAYTPALMGIAAASGPATAAIASKIPVGTGIAGKALLAGARGGIQAMPLGLANALPAAPPAERAMNAAKGVGIAGTAGAILAAGGSVINSVLANKLQPLQSLGQLQEKSQQDRGLGLLADFDKATKSGDKKKMQDIAIEVLRQPQGTAYDDYKSSMYELLKDIKPFKTETYYRGETPMSKQGGNFFTKDPNMAQQYGDKITKIQIDPDTIYKAAKLPKATGDSATFKQAVEQAQKLGFKNVLLDEGSGLQSLYRIH